MYHMLQHSYKPEVRASRRQHPAFQNLIIEIVEAILHETEIVHADNRRGTKLFNSMDTFFSYGLYTRDRAFWRCVRQFLPRAEQEMLIAECGNANDRYLSIAWLKSAFNKGTLYFQMLSLNNTTNRHYLKRFYHENSCIRNSALLEAVTDYIGKLQHVQFAFYSTRQLRPEPRQAIIIDTPSTAISSREARQRKMTETESSIETVLNVLPTEVPPILSATIDQDVLLDEIVRNRRNRLNSERINAEKANYEIENNVPDIKEPETHEELRDVMVQAMSAVNLEQPSSNNLVEVLAEEDISESHVYELREGEYQIQQRDILHLAINTFEMPSERTLDCFVLYENFHSDSKLLRYLLITNYNMYILKHDKNTEPSTSSDMSESPVPGVFNPVIRIPHDRINTVKVGCDNLSMCITSDERGFITYENEEEVDDGSKTLYWASICSYDTGSRMISSMVNITEHTSRAKRHKIEVDFHASYMCLLKPSFEKQLRRNVNIFSATLCYWFEHSLDLQKNLNSVSGYLYKRNINSYSNWLLKNQSEQEQKFCMISGSKMYVFVDSTCKEGEQVIDLSKSEYLPDGRNSFTLKTPQGTFEFESIDKEHFSEWGTAIQLNSEGSGSELYLTPSLTVLTEDSIVMVQEGERFWNDGFLRLLNDIPVESIETCVLVYPEEESFFGNETPAICIVTKCQKVHYLFVRFPSEIERVGGELSTHYGFTPIKMDKEFVKTPHGKAIHDTCCSVTNLWPMD